MKQRPQGIPAAVGGLISISFLLFTTLTPSSPSAMAQVNQATDQDCEKIKQDIKELSDQLAALSADVQRLKDDLDKVDKSTNQLEASWKAYEEKWKDSIRPDFEYLVVPEQVKS